MLRKADLKSALLLVAVLAASSVSVCCHGFAQETQGTIVGSVLARPGAPSHHAAEPIGVAGQNITLVDLATGKAVARTVTASDGSFALSVPAGNYSVQGSGQAKLVRVQPGEAVKVEFALPAP